MKIHQSIGTLPTQWRARAADFRTWAAAEGAACALEQAAGELELALNEAQLEPLSLAAAARESGFSVDHLGRQVRNGRIPNAGRLNAPRILRRDLPRKSAGLPPGGSSAMFSIPKRRVAASVVHSSRRQSD